MIKATANLDTSASGFKVPAEIYGHFAEHLGSCIYGGLWVGEDSDIPNTDGIRNDVVEALRALDIPVLRWPGGCFADEYHWRDGIGPREERPSMINTTWGKVVENNHFGTHEFFRLVELLDTKAYVCGNVGSGTVQEMMEWVEYMTSDADSPLANLRRANGQDKAWELPYFGVGNESWGCGGNMRPEFYADEYRRYNTFVKNYGKRVYRIACGSNGEDYRWTEVLMDRAAPMMNGLSLHYYTLPRGMWNQKGPATGFDIDEYMDTLAQAARMDEIVTRHSKIMDRYDPQRRVGMIIDEWGVWTDAEPGTNPAFLYQQNSLRDAIVAGLTFHIFHKHAERVHMANIAQTVNVLQAMILTDGPRMLRTPTYWVFEMFKKHQDGTFVPVKVESPTLGLGVNRMASVSVSATRKEGQPLFVSLVNLDPEKGAEVTLGLGELQAKSVNGRVLTAGAVDAHNTFDSPDAVMPKAFDGASIADGKVTVNMPAKSIVVLDIL